jgi:curved DNA-binding protein CbpA
VIEKDYYKLLQIDPEADPDVVTAAYRALARRLDPARDLTGVHQVRLAELDRAYAVLADSSLRRAYDARRTQQVPVGPGQHAADLAPRLAAGALSERMQAGLHGENLSSLKLDFGRYAGWTLGDLARQDPDYLRWLSRHSSGIRYRSAILRLLAAQDTVRTPLHVQS